MMYPYIYTGTRYHDFRVVTSQMLHNLPHSVEQHFEDVARAMIKAENSQLGNPSWILVKKNGYILWGIAVLNRVLGNQCQDDDNRPVRGFFGLISDNLISCLPYDISYFKMLYDAYVTPIWDSLEQTQQVIKQMPPMTEGDFIEKSPRLNNGINVDNSICRIYPSTSDSKSLIEAVFTSVEDCSIATNVHSKKQCVEFGKDKISFKNAVMSSDSKVNKVSDEKVFVPIKDDDIITDSGNENEVVIQKDPACSICGSPVNANENVCEGCNNKQQNKKYIKYGLYGFIALICLMLMFNGSSIWKKVLSSKHPHEKVQIEEDRTENHSGRIKSDSYFLNTTKHEVNVSDANLDDVFMIAYESSSVISRVNTSNNWIKIITPSQQFSKKGIIEFMCEPLTRGHREGAICLTNEDGIKTTIPIYQSVSSDERNIDHASHAVRAGGNAHNVIVIESDAETPGAANSAEMEPTFKTSIP